MIYKRPIFKLFCCKGIHLKYFWGHNAKKQLLQEERAYLFLRSWLLHISLRIFPSLMEIPYHYWTCPILPNVFSRHSGEMWALQHTRRVFLSCDLSAFLVLPPLRSVYSSLHLNLEYNLFNIFISFRIHYFLSFFFTLNFSFTSFINKNNFLPYHSLTKKTFYNIIHTELTLLYLT